MGCSLKPVDVEAVVVISIRDTFNFIVFDGFWGHFWNHSGFCMSNMAGHRVKRANLGLGGGEGEVGVNVDHKGGTCDFVVLKVTLGACSAIFFKIAGLAW